MYVTESGRPVDPEVCRMTNGLFSFPLRGLRNGYTTFCRTGSSNHASSPDTAMAHLSESNKMKSSFGGAVFSDNSSVADFGEASKVSLHTKSFGNGSVSVNSSETRSFEHAVLSSSCSCAATEFLGCSKRS